MGLGWLIGGGCACVLTAQHSALTTCNSALATRDFGLATRDFLRDGFDGAVLVGLDEEARVEAGDFEEVEEVGAEVEEGEAALVVFGGFVEGDDEAEADGGDELDVGEVEGDFPGDAFGGGGEVVLNDGGFVLAELFALEAGDEHAVDEGAFNVGGVQHAFVSGTGEKGSGDRGDGAWSMRSVSGMTRVWGRLWSGLGMGLVGWFAGLYAWGWMSRRDWR